MYRMVVISAFTCLSVYRKSLDEGGVGGWNIALNKNPYNSNIFYANIYFLLKRRDGAKMV